MAKSDRTTDTQYGALPFRVGPHGLEIMLITSRERKRWVIPKGWPMAGKKPYRVAEIEAFQEAGVKGVVAKKPIGAYPYTKALPGGEERLCLVEVYPLHVALEAVEWREKPERKRMWFRAEEAVDLVDEGGLALIIDEWRLTAPMTRSDGHPMVLPAQASGFQAQRMTDDFPRSDLTPDERDVHIRE